MCHLPTTCLLRCIAKMRLTTQKWLSGSKLDNLSVTVHCCKLWCLPRAIHAVSAMDPMFNISGLYLWDFREHRCKSKKPIGKIWEHAMNRSVCMALLCEWWNTFSGSSHKPLYWHKAESGKQQQYELAFLCLAIKANGDENTTSAFAETRFKQGMKVPV